MAPAKWDRSKLRLLRGPNWFNPYYVEDYELSNILFFRESDIVVSTGCGWFGQGNNEMGSLQINAPYTVKRKPDYRLKTAFLVPVKGEHWQRRSKKAELYIPFDVFDWQVERDGYKIDAITERLVYDVYRNLTLGFETHIHIRTEPIEANIAFLDAIKPMVKLVSNDYNASYDRNLIKNREQIVAEVKRLAAEGLGGCEKP